MKTIKYLFSFKGRINRAKFWLVMLIPLVLVILGLLIGGILVAQSMISSAKYQKLCRELVTEGSFTGECSELRTLYTEFKSSPQKPGDEHLNAYDFCMAKTTDQSTTVSCDEFVNIYPRLKSLEIPREGDEAAKTDEPASKESPSALTGLIALVTIPFVFAIWWVTLALYAKRLHDYNLSGWWQAAPFALSLLAGGLNTVSPALGGLLMIISSLGSLALFIICGFLKGTTGPNKYGPDPLQK